MANRTAVYDSEAVDLIVCDIPITDGRAETFVTVTPVEDAFDTETGIDGHTCYFATHNNTYDVEVSLKRSSEHNQQLAAVHAADRSATGGAGIGVFLLKDNSGATIYAADRCRIMALPAFAFGKAIGDVTWKFRIVALPLGMIPGGN